MAKGEIRVFSVLRVGMSRLASVWLNVQKRSGWLGDLWPYSFVIMISVSPVFLGRFILKSEELRILFFGIGILSSVSTGISILLDRTLIPLAEKLG